MSEWAPRCEFGLTGFSAVYLKHLLASEHMLSTAQVLAQGSRRHDLPAGIHAFLRTARLFVWRQRPGLRGLNPLGSENTFSA